MYTIVTGVYGVLPSCFLSQAVTMTYGSNFQLNLDGYMKREDISHNSIAKKTGVSQKTVWSVASGRSTPTLNTAQVVADAVGVDARVMLGSELTPEQVGRSQRIGRMLDQIIHLNSEQLATLNGVLKAFTSTE
jgi:transcriptional regulator with XRE-family HTH domain